MHERITLKSLRNNEKTSGENFPLSSVKLYLAKMEWSRNIVPPGMRYLPTVMMYYQASAQFQSS